MVPARTTHAPYKYENIGYVEGPDDHPYNTYEYTYPLNTYIRTFVTYVYYAYVPRIRTWYGTWELSYLEVVVVVVVVAFIWC